VLELLNAVVNQELPFASSISGIVILVVLGANTLVLFAMAFGVAYLSMTHAESERHIKRLIRDAIAEAKHDGT
jgi:hypothetical protein